MQVRTRERLLQVLLESEPRPFSAFSHVIRFSQEHKTADPHAIVSTAKEETESNAGKTLQELSQHLGLRPPTILRHLERMELEGWIRRVANNARSPKYRAAPFFEAKWSDPELGVFLQWRSRRGIDWRFPLVSRLPDLPGQHILLRLLPEIQDRFETHLADPAHAGDDVILSDLCFVAYGSCARGDARPGSDLDLVALSIVEVPQAIVNLVRKSIQKASLWAERPVQLQFVCLEEWERLPTPLRKAILRDGMTMHYIGKKPSLIESSEWQDILQRRAT